jgi:aconitase B
VKAQEECYGLPPPEITMPLDMPESVLVRFKGKKNVFSGRILEIEGL